MVKHVFVTGGVVSSLGKGTTAASLGRLLKSRGLKVVIQKFDPYINIDPAIMSPYQHGEVFVTEDGAETDLDLGHYERFVDTCLSRNNSVSAGKVYWSVLNKERQGAYFGGTVQVIPHITNEIKERLRQAEKECDCDIIITEIGGTVGDIESLPFLEAIRQLRAELGRENVLYIHVTLVPYIKAAGEAKTKPTQHSVKELRSLGIQPNIIVCRVEKPLTKELIDKLALFCDIDREAVIQAEDVESVYDIPPMLQRGKLDDIALKHFNLDVPPCAQDNWAEFYQKSASLEGEVKILLVGKYAELQDAYLSVTEALQHAAVYYRRKLVLRWCCSSQLNEENLQSYFKGVHGVIVPGGFGQRGSEGKILAAKYSRENGLPFFGIGLGMQMAVVEFARNAAGLDKADSYEFDPHSPCPVIAPLPGPWEDEHDPKPPMRLGLYPCYLQPDSQAWTLYGEKECIEERHRHRYMLNGEYEEILAQHGLVVSGFSKEKIAEIIELKGHPYFIGCQFHPEFISRPHRPHPLFLGLIKAGLDKE